MNRRTARWNRAGLSIAGAILLLAGVAALARGLDLWPDLVGSASAAVIDPVNRELTANTWFWVVLAIALVLLALLALWWLLSQLWTGAVPTLRVEPDARRGSTTVPARVASRALETDLTGTPSFQQARASLWGSRWRPRLNLTATLAPTADYGTAKRRLHEALDRHRQTLDVDQTPTTVLVRSAR